jgi:hypothetical protein
MKINWIPVEGYSNKKFVSAHSIATLTVELNGTKNEKSNHSVKADVAGRTPYILFTGSMCECELFMLELIKQTGSTLEPLRKFDPRTAVPLTMGPQ